MSSATVRGIAGRLGVSPATVSRSLNNPGSVSETVRERVLAEARRVGYEFVRRPQRTGRLGLLFYDGTSGPRFSGYDAVIWGAVTRAAVALQYDVCTLNPLDRRQESFAAFAARKGVEGLVLRVDEGTRQVALEVAADQVPHVVIADRFDDERVNYVCCKSMGPSRDAIEHLVHLGHHRIALCHNTIIDTDHRDRIDGYHTALADGGITADSDLIISTNAEIGAGAAAFNRLMSLPSPPTAIFFTDPAVTVGALRRALEVGVRVPDELSIVGFDDERLRTMTHPIYTSVCQDAAGLGHQAGRWLCRQLQHRSSRGAAPASLRMEIDAFLEINQTTAPPPALAVRVTPTGQRLNGESQSAIRAPGGV